MITNKEKNFIFKILPNLISIRNKNSHKGTFGTLGIIGGSKSMCGSCLLSGSVALKVGCGKVIIGFNQKKLLFSIIESIPELILKTANELINEKIITGWVIGCGLGTKYKAFFLMKKILKHVKNGKNVLIDADGLNVLSKFKKKNKLTKNCVITPHMKEASLLLSCSIEKIKMNRKKSAIKLAKKFNCWVVLKGYKTIIASYNEDVFINKTGNVSLATSGTGDVLAGIIGSLIVQKIPIKESIIGGVWLHGKAADNLVLQGLGPIGLTAHELIDEVRKIRNQIIRLI